MQRHLANPIAKDLHGKPGEAITRTVADMAWDDVGRSLERGMPAILPIGAGAKQHGLHLPMNTDQVQAEWLAARVAERIDALIWPTLSYGYYPAFVAYAGSVSISASTFEAIVRDIVGGLIGYGVRAVLVLNTGLSTIDPIGRAIAGFGNDQVHHLKVYDGPQLRGALARLTGETSVGHADEIETSCMLAIAPERVAMARAAASRLTPANAAPGPLTPNDPASRNYSPSGTLGDPRGASRQNGELLLTAMVADLVDTATAAIAGATAAARPVTDHAFPAIPELVR